MNQDVCYSCAQTAQLDTLPIRERIYHDGMWRVAHAFNSALPGWLVLLPQRHIVTLAELNPKEVTALGPLLRHLTQALIAGTGCTKTYVLLLAEAPGFHHLHLHVVPRMPDLPREHKGVKIFDYLDRPEAEWVSPSEMDRLGAAVAQYLQTAAKESV